MNMKHFSDNALLARTGDLIRQENEAFTLSLHCLLEIERRRLYAKERYSSLFAMLMKEYGQSESQATRRIAAMELLKEVPEAEEKMLSGSLNLTNAVLARTHFRKEATFADKPLSKVEKLELIESLENKSTREAERIILSVSSAPVQMKPDMVKPVTATLNEHRFFAESQLQEQIERTKGLIAHKNPNPTMNELLSFVFDVALKVLDPADRKVRQKKSKAQQATPSLRSAPKVESAPPKVALSQTRASSQPENAAATWETQLVVPQRKSFGTPMNKQRISSEGQQQVLPMQTALEKRTHIPAGIRREVWRRANSQCQICGSRYALQTDHIIPVGKGGGNELSNLRLLCRSCNQRAAIEHFGQRKMNKYRPLYS